MLHKTIILLLALLFAASFAGAAERVLPGVPDRPFVQERSVAYPLANAEANDVRAVAVDPAGNAWAATKAGVYELKKGAEAWTSQMTAAEAGPSFDVAVDGQGVVWAGAWDGLYRSQDGALKKVEGITAPIAAVCATPGGIAALGPDGFWKAEGDTVTAQPLPCAPRIRAATSAPDGSLWISTGAGLYHHAGAEDTRYLSQDELLSCDVYDTACAPDGSLWIGGLGGITVYKGDRRVSDFTARNGLPNVYVQGITASPGGAMWVATTLGVARYNGKTWSLRHSRRWLLSDDVRDIAFGPDGAAWLATAAGVNVLSRADMTLADKADQYLAVCLSRHVRAPGLVEKCLLKTAGDLSTWQPRDDDNDGQYTAMYLAMQSFRYAATKDPAARTAAKKAFAALHFLQTVTETPGFVARSVIPTSWTSMSDRNETVSDRAWADRRTGDPREKRVENHWLPSKDGQWLWKGDTSSDEITGHMFGYLWYYDLAADASERALVRAHVCKVVDYIIAGGLVLKDLDGAHTRWGVWSPEKLNEDPSWIAERGINSLEILSYLKLAHHVCGDEKYQKLYLSLLHDHHYAENVRHAKAYNPAWRTHIDDELLALAYPCLLLYESDPELARLYRESLDHWYQGVRADQSSFFNFTYGSLTGTAPELDASIFDLRDAPVDLVRWTVDNSQREDLPLVRAPEIEPLQTSRLAPPSERGILRWDENPWKAVQGDGGQTESDGVFWLLPYWMGRCYGYIQAAQ